MTPTPAKIHAICLLFALVCTGATAAPRERLPDADSTVRALALATGAGAATYAPLELRAATQQLDEARAALADGDAKLARRLLDRSSANSDLALAKSRLARVREDSGAKAAQIEALRQRLGLPPAAAGDGS